MSVAHIAKTSPASIPPHLVQRAVGQKSIRLRQLPANDEFSSLFPASCIAYTKGQCLRCRPLCSRQQLLESLGAVLFAFSRCFPRGSVMFEEMKRCGAAIRKSRLSILCPNRRSLRRISTRPHLLVESSRILDAQSNLTRLRTIVFSNQYVIAACAITNRRRP
jgi:hypothetical protein